MIAPTIGRRVWYWPSHYDLSSGDAQLPPMTQHDPAQAFDAGVTFVWSDRMVNLVVTDHIGGVRSRQSVRLLQDGDVPQPGEAFAQWMPYQREKQFDKVIEASPAPSRLPFPAFPSSKG